MGKLLISLNFVVMPPGTP